MFSFSLHHYCTAIVVVVAAAAASLVVNVAIGRQSNVIDRPPVSSVDNGGHIARHAASDTLSHTDRPILSYHTLPSTDVCRSHAYVHRPLYVTPLSDQS